MTNVFTAAQDLIRKNAEKRHVMQQARLLKQSVLFDGEWYLKNNPDVAATKFDPLLHFLLHGAGEGRDPSDQFSTRYYIESNPDVAEAGVNPLVHYVSKGAGEGRRPHAGVGEGFDRYPSEKLSRHGLADVTEYMAKVATPAHLLARPDPSLYSPLISIILPVWNTSPQFLYEVLQSIYCQTYVNWELCVVDDASTNKSTLEILREIDSNPKIKLSHRTTNGGIALASHAALQMASGDYVAFVDHDDLLAPNALSDVVALLREDRAIDYIYTDHAQADGAGLPRSISRKPEWSPEFLLSTNYIVHFKVVRRQLLLDVGGLENEQSFVQDLGMTLRLWRVGAKIKFLPRVAYYWREHGGSVAATSASKPGIEGMLLDEYNKHARELERGTHSFWPRSFKARRVGVFEMSFPAAQSSTAIVVIAPPSMSIDPDAIKLRLTPQLQSGATLNIVALHQSQETNGVTVLKNDAAIQEFFAKITADYVVLIGAAGRCISPTGLSALTGYLDADANIGAVGAKVLDNHLRVKAGGLLMTETGALGLVCGGMYDDAVGHWFINQVASNVDAVSGRCMAVRRRHLVEREGLMLHKWGELAGLVLCQDIRGQGYRIVYNPCVKVYDPNPLLIDRLKLTELYKRNKKATGARIYKEL